MVKTIQREIRKRGFFGKLIKWSFILFNILMVIWVVSAFGSAGEAIDGMTSDAERAGAAIGTTIGVAFILAIWGFGAFILGMLTFFTRGSPVLVTEEVS